jgi:DNA-binding MarR family transcriptional regulator
MLTRDMDTRPKRANLRVVTTPEYRTHIPYLLGAISNVLATGGARLYRGAFGIGLGEWRLMWVLGHAGPLNAHQASQIMGIDKGATSRAVGELDRRGLVTVTLNPADTRQRTIELSERGRALHSRIMVVSRERERRLASAFSDEELELLTKLLVRLHAHSPYVNDFDPLQILQASAGPGAAGDRNVVGGPTANANKARRAGRQRHP